MEFKKLLIDLHRLYEEAEFDSTEVSVALKVPTKIASNDLRRLCQMRFLKRRRAARKCLSMKGDLYSRGFKYLYTLSNQGLSYIRWLTHQKPIEDLSHVKLYSEVLSHLPEDLRRDLCRQETIRSSFRYRGPGSNRRLSGTDSIPLAYLLLENEKLRSNNHELAFELLRKILENKRVSSEESTLETSNLIYRLENLALQKERDKWRQDCGRVFEESSKILVREIRFNSSVDLIASRIKEAYRQCLCNLLTILYLILPYEAVNKLVELTWSSDDRVVESLAEDLQKLELEIYA